MNFIIAVLSKFFLVNPALSTGTIISIALLVFSVVRNKLDFEEIYLLVTMVMCVVWGYILWIIVNAGGKSEMYFAMASFIPQYVLISEMHKEAKEVKILYRTMIKNIFMIMLIISVALFSFYGHVKWGMVTSVYKGIESLLSAEIEQTENWEKSTCIRKSDVEALKWIRDNTAVDALVLSDRAVMTVDRAYYCYGMYSERQQYLEGTNLFFQLDDESQKELMRRINTIWAVYWNDEEALLKIKEEGVDFIVQTKDITPDFEYNPERMKLMFSTDTINIYQIR